MPDDRRIPGLVLRVLLLLVGSAPAWANDTLVTLGAGGLVPVNSSDIEMRSETLAISPHRITVTYLFHNAGDHDVDATVAFPLPALNGGGVYNEPMSLPSGEDDNFLGFKVMQDGASPPVKMEARAFLDDRDITARLRATGVPASVLLGPLNLALSKLTKAQRARLETDQLIVSGDFNPGLRGVGEHGWWAAWSMRVQFYWTQHFPAGKTIELVQTYSPVVGGSYIPGGGSDAATAAAYCADPAALGQIKALVAKAAKPDAQVAVDERRIQYILTTANNWAGPIGRFHLTVDTDSPDDIFLTCMPGVKRLSPTRYELERSNFRPDRELDLMILQRRQ